MNVDNQTILHIRAGHLPPEALMKHILAKKPTAFGFAVQEADGADMQVMHEDGDNLDVETLKSFLDGRKDRPTTMFFGQLKKPYDVEDIQPFTLKDPNGSTFMTVWTEGDILNNGQPAAHTEQFNFVSGTVIPKICEWCEDFDGDIAKIMAKVRGSVFENDVKTHLGHRGILHILPFVGDPVLISKDNLLKIVGDWGWISNGYGYTEAKKEEPKAVEKPKSRWGIGTKKAEAEPAAPAPAPVVEPKKEEKLPDGVHKVGGTTIVDKAKEGGIAIAVKPPAWLLKNQDVQEFYRIVSGKSHPGWKKRLPVTVTQNHAILQCKNLDEYTQWKLANYKEKLESSTAPMTTNAEKPQTKQERIAAQAEKKEVQGPISPTDLPIIDAKAMEKVMNFVAQHLDGNSKEIPDPKEMQQIEAKLPKFSDSVGVKLEEMLNWPVSGLFALAATDPRAMVLWGLEWRAYARQYLMAEMKAQKKDGHVKTSDPRVDKTADVKLTESVSTGDNPAKKKASWGYGKKAA